MGLEEAQITSSQPDLKAICDTLIELAFEAGKIITGALPDTGTTGAKKNSSDLVTDYDRARYPDFELHGEEFCDPSFFPLTDAPTFIIEPIDGTVNFIHGFPHACVSIGFAVSRIPAVGVVLNPFTQTLYSAIRGKGAFIKRDIPLPLRGAETEPLSGLEHSLIGIEWGSARTGNNWETKIRTFEKLGSAALNLCAVAAGTLDLYWEGGCWAWGVCAGWIILEEAGGIIVGGNPGEWRATVDGRKYLAIRAAPSGVSQRTLVEEFWGAIQGRLQY
ncbi:hypothetical protein BJY04DRAFT_208120 [Aspergillus karnatakaensis]|uniref:inositol monophosphatase family protein n=1 Tax=Aspergillus karnatakaensis TaxID=1810916 RepID=UPI003CCDD084